MPEKPDVYGVYRGRVSNVLEFGCFVELQGFRKKAEGLVHTSNISKQRCAPATSSTDQRDRQCRRTKIVSRALPTVIL